MNRKFYFGHLVFIVLISSANCFSWILSNMLSSAIPAMELDEADIALSNSVTVGAYTAVSECAKQFQYDRWNCPTSSFFLNPNDNPEDATTTKRSLSFARISQSALLNLDNLNSSDVAILNGLRADRQINRETALVRAMTSAGITFTLTKNCSAGDFANCVCDTKFSRQKKSFRWGGCSDNFHFGSQVSRQFLDAHENGADPISLVNLHNNAAGRMAVKKTMRRMCKCHGVSGSCATQTCWRQISDFHSVGNYLKKMYKKAVKVTYSDGKLTEKLSDRNFRKLHQRGRSSFILVGKEANRPSNQGIRDRRQLFADDRDDYENTYEYNLSRSRNIRRGRWVGPKEQENPDEKLKKRFIVFLNDSPDYCKANKKFGYHGVLGRKCSSDPSDPNGKVNTKMCTKLCRGCGLKAHKKVTHIYTSCKCRFRWCCDVTCESCRRKKVEIICVEP